MPQFNGLLIAKKNNANVLFQADEVRAQLQVIQKQYVTQFYKAQNRVFGLIYEGKSI